MKSRLFINISLAVDLLIAISKFVAAAITGSSSMISEGIHSVIDAISQLLLIWGIKTSSRIATGRLAMARNFIFGRSSFP
jgi:divalent metal cation (Fe/Co/Zn/Cd) transporter